ncbi:hypothetical protein K437DRAFT_246510 [Tilletiaria anomala UBC 951]|uniref:Mitochondrial-processing peptidase subunit alpha n=1 Tax=Tilletiaria anomala (strain ATCC 24038 / CBS 436.72 / UBC 951) TaxID=1037660 RepID=A0A066W1N7_TILAU|nr:uncharacterized protein K437DRAFT_246510 [Tilletiaria anomala UBC 951]KDN46463.1 hypothetical protein K437DRAFT_246510 [Tilletiaria anomala UBC 951]
MRPLNASLRRQICAATHSSSCAARATLVTRACIGGASHPLAQGRSISTAPARGAVASTPSISSNRAGPSPSTARNRLLSPQTAARALSAAAASANTGCPSSYSRLRDGNSSHSSPLKCSNRALSSSAASRSSEAAGGAPIHSASLIEISSLSNGVRVATEATPGHFSAAGIYIDAGSRFERPWVDGESGVSHLLDRMAFKSTTNRASEKMISEIEALGGNVMCSSARETIMYQSSFFNKDFESVLSILADTIVNPLLEEEELVMQKEAARYEISEITRKPEMNLPELIHTIAYRDNTLGNPLLCPIENLDKMTSKNLKDFMRTWYTPERIVVAGAGMPHEALVREAEKLFGGMKPRPLLDATSSSTTRPNMPSSASSANSTARSSSIFSSPSSSGSSASASSYGSADFSTTAARSATHADAIALSPAEIGQAKARYTGGEAYIEQEDSEFTHVYVAFEGVGIHDEDVYALATLQVLLGGGGSFSAGGPGKGMYSRLYTNVLNQYHAVDHCSAFHHCYNDSGLFGIAASVNPSFNGSIGHVIARELNLCTGPNRYGGVTFQELLRARNQLKSSLMMALESRMVEVEDLGRQVLVHGKKISVEEMCEKIDQVDLQTLYRVASRVFKGDNAIVRKSLNYGLGSGQATVVCQGKLENLQDLRMLLYHQGLGADPRQQA